LILEKLVEGLKIISYNGNFNKNITKITYDSKQCTLNSLFIAIKGYKTDGHDYIEVAIKNGAIAIICESVPKKLETDITYIQVEDSRSTQAFIANRFYEYPSKKLKMIGITGTNGKTSVAFLISKILGHWGKKIGNIGTIGNYVGDTYYKAKNTTPEAIDLQQMLSQMVNLGIKYTVMEVSSHSLSLKRVNGTNFNIGIFTNLSQDHLDFHQTHEKYFEAKTKLFYITNKANIINGDDPYGKRLIDMLKNSNIRTYSFGITDKCDYMAKDIFIDSKGVSFTFEGEKIKEKFQIGIPGIFSVYNAMAAIITGYIEQVPMETIKSALSDVSAVPGRFEVVNTNTPYNVIIDYAHTPDGLENVLKTINSFSKKRIILVFGCGGDRDKTKRPIMGEIGGKYSSFSIITSDNPRSEDPLSIIKDIIPGIKNTNCPYKVIENRREAIMEALSMAKKDDIILIAGKGHETYQILHDKTIPFDEKLIIKELLSEDE
jgi:UDP-N-acetylmuramoyl-L-alanyl-D-glutamate--2,6-diaminopimelate ligase